ncbi:flagellar hook-basal body complex protein [Clostridium sp. DJ247]|uniref:flagellar hook-basal body complex protein n=1 Tax=Clostridium sp. DJ247 TaxID=2726188 RepID=UPI0016254AE4|nr:flagellar hook-basal body complex protein [Clostridium sp. DJ247]MBC2580668.1 flagellar basal body rod protein FlgG [Clostridium sp. DJ247]MBC2580681.1 flagellar basal body rod protein FlgG [Clostridium sp. DJ247]
MLRILWNGRSAMNAEQQKLDSISNNIANVNTVGYKKENVSFQDLVYENLKRTGYPTNDNNKNEILNGTGVKAGQWIRDTTQGTLRDTGVKTDLAIDGDGYFRVTLPDGSKAYERAGSFNIDNNGDIVDKNGNRLDIAFTQEGSDMFNSGKVFTSDNFAVKQSGEIYVNDNSNSVLYGNINTYSPIGQDSLTSVGENLYVPNAQTQMNGTTDTNIMQGFLEDSNVDVGKEMTDMIVAQRAFELGSRAMKTGDEMWGLINSMKGR